ncbi:hypothetical protein AK88_05231 [Plasmodium fragile]|uniref:Schizont-infected cell agglutination extracellular alpha domain-containing protein n=1 Tax=Plasmodium fragile TaxID=5857 RepID=A0A0D9QDU9_PLAFR|nr:uncharacterized protein AK88_05231 [Plasmodium fragile]KJP85134.1 hypothetical protein AK88_05231 [Plasmodium fragile]
MASPGGGNGGTGGAPGGGGKENGKIVKAGHGEACAADRAQQRPRTAVYVVPPLNKDEWNKWKQVLEHFTKYMDEHKDLADAYGANCYNVGWDDVDPAPRKDQTVADVVRCRVMSVAWGFANRWDKNEHDTGERQSTDEDEKENMLRCEVVNVFGHLLKNKYCNGQRGYKRGVEYARIAFRHMKSAGTHGAGVVGGPVTAGKCTACGYDQHTRSAHAINWKVAEWLLYEGQILQGIENIEDTRFCNTKWAHYTQGKMKDGNPNVVNETKITEIKPEQEKLRKKATKKMDEVKEALEKKIQEMRDKHMNAAEAKKKNHDGTKSTEGSTQDDSSENAQLPAAPSPKGRSETSAADAPVPTSPSVPQPPPPQPKNENDQAGSGQGPGQGPGPGQQPPPPPPPPPDNEAKEPGAAAATPTSKDTQETGKCPKTPGFSTVQNEGRGVYGATSSTSVSFGTSSETDNTCGKNTDDTGAGSVLSEFRQQKHRETKNTKVKDNRKTSILVTIKKGSLVTSNIAQKKERLHKCDILMYIYVYEYIYLLRALL